MIDLRIINITDYTKYQNIPNKDPKALYFLTDIGKLYKGDIEIKGFVYGIDVTSQSEYAKTMVFTVTDEINGGNKRITIPFTDPDGIKNYIDSEIQKALGK